MLVANSNVCMLHLTWIMATAADHLPLLHSGRAPTQLRLLSRTAETPLSSTTTPHDDPLRILVPAQKKLSTIESQRVLAIINETSRRLGFALAIPSLVAEEHHLSVPLGSELVALLQEYKDAIAEFSTLQQTVETSTSSLACSIPSSCSSIENTESETQLLPVGSMEERRLHSLRNTIRHTVKSILRALSTNPSILESVHRERVLSQSRLMECLQGLCSVSNEMLRTTRTEEVKRREYLQLVATRRLSMEESIKKLETELAVAQSQKDKEVSEKRSQINQLRSKITSVAASAQDTARKIHSEAKKQETQAETTHSTTRSKLEEEIGSVKKQLQDSVADDKGREQETRKKTFKRELEVDNWIKKYDDEMGEKQDELEMLGEQFTEEKKQLKELEEKLGILKLKYDAALKEQEEARLKAEQEAEERKRMTKAALKIQRYWKAYHKRKMEAKLAQKGKKKGKGKGKGKKN